MVLINLEIKTSWMKKYLIPILLIILSGCAKQVVGEYTYAPCGSILNQTYISDSLDLYMTTFGDTDINLSRKGYPGLKLKKQIFLFNNSDKKNGFDINIFQFTSLEEYEKKILDRNLKSLTFYKIDSNRKSDSSFMVHYQKKNKEIIERIVKLDENSFLRIVASANQNSNIINTDYLKHITEEQMKLSKIGVFKELQSYKNNFFVLRTKLDSLFKNNPSYQIRYLQKLYPAAQITDTMSWQRLLIEYVNLYNSIGSYGNSLHHLKMYEQLSKKNKAPYKDVGTNITLQNLEEFINSQDSNLDVIILNDDHSYPRSRWVASLFLDLLRERGFKYLAVETLTNWKDRDFVTVINFGDGYYSEEPTFNIFLRLAVEKGFKLIPYENYEACQPFTEEDKNDRFFCSNFREYNQAKNIAKIFENEPEAKVFVYAGHGHGKKIKSGSFNPMGSVLSEMLLDKKIVSID